MGEVADATPTKCRNDANGGLMCCLNDVVAGAAPVPAKCVEKTASEKEADKAKAFKKTCEEAADKKYVEAVTAVAASGKDEFKCVFTNQIICKESATVNKYPEDKKEACLAVAAGDTEATVKAACTAAGGDPCVPYKSVSAVAKVEAVPAKCVAKVCGDYGTEGECKGECKWKAKVSAVAFKYKCKADTALTDAGKKTKCEGVADATPTKCLNDANGGLMCCLNDVVAGAAPVPAKCVEKPKPAATEKPKPAATEKTAKETTDTPLSGVAVAMTSAFAAAAAGLLL